MLSRVDSLHVRRNEQARRQVNISYQRGHHRNHDALPPDHLDVVIVDEFHHAPHLVSLPSWRLLWDPIDQQHLSPFLYSGIHDGLDLREVPWRRGRGYDIDALSTTKQKAFCTVLDFVGTHRREFRFDRRFRALLGGSRRDVE